MTTPEILTGNFAPLRWGLFPPRSLRVVDWNIDRGLHLNGVIDFLAGEDPDLVLLQEADVNARRTQRLNIAEEIARKLQMNYVFGTEFEELVQGTKESPAYHGQATLSKWPLSAPRLIHFSHQSHFWQPHWFLPRIEPFQERRGGRIALVTEVNVARSKFLSYNLHLESRGNDKLRLSQLEEVVADAMRQDQQDPMIIAGDFNLDVGASKDVALLEHAGFHDAIDAGGEATTPSRSMFEAGRPIDWAFIRGPIQANSGRIHRNVKASDHYPISFTLTA